MFSTNVISIERIQGERRPVSCRLNTPQGADISDMTASFIYKNELGQVVEQGACVINGDIISVMLEHENNGTFTLLITCEVAGQIIRGMWRVMVHDTLIRPNSNP